jgi:hypothetical protein
MSQSIPVCEKTFRRAKKIFLCNMEKSYPPLMGKSFRQ